MCRDHVKNHGSLRELQVPLWTFCAFLRPTLAIKKAWVLSPHIACPIMFYIAQLYVSNHFLNEKFSLPHAHGEILLCGFLVSHAVILIWCSQISIGQPYPLLLVIWECGYLQSSNPSAESISGKERTRKDVCFPFSVFEMYSHQVAQVCGWSWTCHPPASAFRLLQLQARTTMPIYIFT